MKVHQVVTLILILILFWLPSHAMSVDSYQRAARASPEDKTVARAYALAIDTYFQGVAETLNTLQYRTGHIYFSDKPVSCIPSTVRLTGAMLRGILDGELQKPTEATQSLPSDWRTYELPAVLLPLLVRTFPCAR